MVFVMVVVAPSVYPPAFPFRVIIGVKVPVRVDPLAVDNTIPVPAILVSTIVPDQVAVPFTIRAAPLPSVRVGFAPNLQFVDAAIVKLPPPAPLQSILKTEAESLSPVSV
jgi:hypothetical protein